MGSFTFKKVKEPIIWRKIHVCDLTSNCLMQVQLYYLGLSQDTDPINVISLIQYLRKQDT